MFNILLRDIEKFSAFFLLVKEHQSVANEEIAGGNVVFLCLRRFFFLYFFRIPRPWKLKIPGKVLEFCPEEANTVNECCLYGMEQFIRLCMGISNFTVVTVNEIKEL